MFLLHILGMSRTVLIIIHTACALFHIWKAYVFVIDLLILLPCLALFRYKIILEFQIPLLIEP